MWVIARAGRFVLVALAVWGMVPCAGRADMIALELTQRRIIGSSPSIQQFTLGWSFRANQDIDIAALGFWDRDADGLGGSHQVAIWNADGSVQLASTVLPAGTGTTLILDPDTITGFPPSGFRFQSIAPVRLTAGDVYVIGAHYPPFTPDVHYNHSDPGTDIAIATAPEVTYLGARAFNGGFGFPAGPDTSPPIGRFGPNFTFEQVAVGVPEPSTFVLTFVAAGCGLLGYLGRRMGQRWCKSSCS